MTSKCLTICPDADTLTSFEAARTEIISRLPNDVRCSIVDTPVPHLTLLYDCNDRLDVAHEIMGERAIDISISCEPKIGDYARVLLLPIDSPELIALFNQLYESEKLVPSKKDCKHRLFSQYVTSRNKYGFSPHITLATFSECTDMDRVRDVVGTRKCDFKMRVTAANIEIGDA